MKYLFFDTAINGYYTLTTLQKEFPGHKKIIAEEERILDDVAPFVFEITDEKLTAFRQNSLISLQKIILAETGETLQGLYNYYSPLVVQTVKGRPFYFRFWAADVFKKFTKTCNAEQLKEFFGPIQKFILDDEDPAYKLQFTLDGSKLITDRISSNPDAVQPAELGKPAANYDSKNESAHIQTEHNEQDGKRPPRRYFY